MTDPLDIMKELYMENHKGPVTPEIDARMREEEALAAKVAGVNSPPPMAQPQAAPSTGSAGGEVPGIDMSNDGRGGLVRSEMPGVAPGELVNTGPGPEVLTMEKGGSLRNRISSHMKTRYNQRI